MVPMRQALKCFCVDTIAEYCFAKSGDMISKPDFAIQYWQDFAKGLDLGMRARYLPRWFLPAVKVAPAWIRASIGPGMQFFEAWHKDTENKVDFVQSKANSSGQEMSAHRTIFHEILTSPELPEADKTRPRLVQEGAAMIGAGGETTSQILGIILFGLLDDKRRLKRLRKELATVSPENGTNVPSLRQLESLPYLVRCTCAAVPLDRFSSDLADFDTDRMREGRPQAADRQDRPPATRSHGAINLLQEH